MVSKLLYLYSLRYVTPFLPHSILMKIADFIGMLQAKGDQASIIRREIRKLTGDTVSENELDQIVSASLSDFKKDLFEIWCFPRLTKQKMEKMAYFTGLNNLDNALQKGKGAVIGVSHFGSWKIIIPALPFAGYPTNQIAINPLSFIDKSKPFYHNKIMEIEYACEQSLPVKFIYVGKLMREVFSALSKNEVVIDSFDGYVGGKSVEVKFLQDRLNLNLGPILLAMKRDVPLLPAFAVRQKDNRHKITIHEEIPLSGYPDKESAVDAVVNTYIKLFEEYVSKKPSHYGRILYERAIAH